MLSPSRLGLFREGSHRVSQITRWAAASGVCTNTPSPLPFPPHDHTLQQQIKAKINHKLLFTAWT